MSHVVKQQASFTDKAALRQACQTLKFPFKEGRQQIKTFSRSIQGDFAIQLPGWKYQAAVDTATGQIAYDNYGGVWGEQQYLEDLNQEYNLVLREQWAEGEGYYTERVPQASGHVQLQITGSH